MSVQIKYVGTQTTDEMLYSGRPQRWRPGQIMEVDADIASLLCNGPWQLAIDEPATRGIISCRSSVTVIGGSEAYNQLATGADLGTGLSSRSHIQWASGRMPVGFDILFVRGVGGKTIQEVIAEQLPAALADDTDVLWVHCMGNNLNIGLGTAISVPAILAQLDILLAEATPVKKLVIVDPIFPTNTVQVAGLIEQVNAGAAQICRKYANVVFNDIYGDMLNTASAALAPITNAMQTDGIHIGGYGAYLAGVATARVMNARVRLKPHHRTVANYAPALSGSGGTKTVGAGSITGNVPTGYDVTVFSGAAAVTLSTMGPGHTQLAITNAGGSASIVLFRLAVPTTMAANFVAGEMIKLGVRQQLRAATLLARANLSLLLNGVTFWHAKTKCADEVPNAFPQVAYCEHLQTPPYTLAATPTSVNLVLTIEVGASTGAVIVDIFDPEILKVA